MDWPLRGGNTSASWPPGAFNFSALDRWMWSLICILTNLILATPSSSSIFRTSWNVALGALQKVRYRWQVVSGPLQALQAYLLDYDFDLSAGPTWRRTGYGGIPDCVLS